MTVNIRDANRKLRAQFFPRLARAVREQLQR